MVLIDHQHRRSRSFDLLAFSCRTGSGVMIGQGLPDARSGWRGSEKGMPCSSRMASIAFRQRAAASVAPQSVVFARSFCRSSMAGAGITLYAPLQFSMGTCSVTTCSIVRLPSIDSFCWFSMSIRPYVGLRQCADALSELREATEDQ